MRCLDCLLATGHALILKCLAFQLKYEAGEGDESDTAAYISRFEILDSFCLSLSYQNKGSAENLISSVHKGLQVLKVQLMDWDALDFNCLARFRITKFESGKGFSDQGKNCQGTGE
jgi:hypothetical protein